MTKDNSNSIYPKVKFGELNMVVQNKLKNDEIPRVIAKLDIPGTKECNAFRIDFDSNISHSKIEEIENELIQNFLINLRVKTNQYWIGNTFYKSQKTYECHKLKMKSSNVFGNKIISNTEKYDNPVRKPIEILQITNDIIQESLAELNDDSIDFSKTKLLDGINSIFMQDFESAVLDLAISVEIRKNLVFKEIWYNENPSKEISEYNQKEVNLKDFDLTSHISKRLKKTIISRSYKDEFPEKHKMICYLWKFRGNIAHGEKPIINHDIQNIKINSVNFDEIIIAVIHCNEFLLQCKNPVKNAYNT